MIRRFRLLPLAVVIVQRVEHISEYSHRGDDEYWPLVRQNVTVVLRRVGNGATHFYSVMD